MLVVFEIKQKQTKNPEGWTEPNGETIVSLQGLALGKLAMKRPGLTNSRGVVALK